MTSSCVESSQLIEQGEVDESFEFSDDLRQPAAGFGYSNKIEMAVSKCQVHYYL